MPMRVEWVCSKCGATGEIFAESAIHASRRCPHCGSSAYTTTNTSIFSEAEQTINGPRTEDYGDANESFAHIAALWSAYLNTPVSSADVAMLMSLLKMARLKYSKFAHHDSFVDLLGYVGLAHKVSGEK